MPFTVFAKNVPLLMFDRDLNTLLQYRETSSKLLRGIEPTRNSVQNYYFLFVFFT